MAKGPHQHSSIDDRANVEENNSTSCERAHLVLWIAVGIRRISANLSVCTLAERLAPNRSTHFKAEKRYLSPLKRLEERFVVNVFDE